MGNYISKIFIHNSDKVDNKGTKEFVPVEANAEVQESNMCTPVITQRKLCTDPRSVTAGIERTPIEVNSTPVSSNNKRRIDLHKNVLIKPYLETDLDNVIPPLAPKKNFGSCFDESTEACVSEQDPQKEIYCTPTINNSGKLSRKLTQIEKDRFKILGLDPRSPAADFTRTPVLTHASMLRLKARSQENLSRRGSYETDMCKYSYCEISNHLDVPEIQAIPDLTTIAVKSLKLDDAESDSTLLESETSSSEESSESVVVLDVVSKDKAVQDARLDEVCLASPDVEDKKSIQPTWDIKQSTVQTPDNDKIRIWRDSPVLEESNEMANLDQEQGEKNKVESPRTAKEEVIITVDDETNDKEQASSRMPKSTGENQKKLEFNAKKIKNSKVDSKMISDEKKVFITDNKNVNDAAKTRTPLGNRSNNGQLQLSSKSPQQFLRSKGLTPKMFQENTPPHRRTIAKTKLSGIQWDPNSTVLI